MSSIILLDATKSLANLAADASNGLGVIQPVNAYVVEQLNGAYEAELTISEVESHINEIQCGGIFKCKPNETSTPQMFRIYAITKPRNGIITVKARHISYDLNKAAVMPFYATGASNALTTLENNLVGSYEFTTYTDIANNTSTFYLNTPASFRAALGGTSGSILDTFGGEYEWDNLTVKLLANRGNNNGVTIEYGKNITDITQDENIENTFNAVLGYATTADAVITGTIQYATVTTAPKTKIVDFTNEFADGSTPSAADIDTLAQQYIAANNIGVPSVSIKVAFQPLYQTEEYKDIAPLERVGLGDTVTVKFPKLGVAATAKVVAYKYDVNRDRYISVEIGDVKSTLASTLIKMTDNTETAKNANAFLESYVANFTALVANSLGLFKTVEVQPDGTSKIYLHNKPLRSNSQYQWTINSNGFFVSQDYGSTWSAGIDSSGNAVFNSLSANVINALTINGSTINSGNMYWYKGESQEADLTPTNIPQSGGGYVKGVRIKGASITLQATNDAGLFFYGNNGQTVDLSQKKVVVTGSKKSMIMLDAIESGGVAQPAVYIYCGNSAGTSPLLNPNGYIAISGGNIMLYGNGVYFNGVQKW